MSPQARWDASATEMLRWLVLSARCVALAGLAFGAPSALGQTMSGMGNADGQQQAQAFATAQQPATASAVPNADVTQIPNSGGDTTGLQGYQSNPSGLTAAGQNAASTSDSLNTALLASANANRNVVKNTDSWLQQSLGIVQDPTSVIHSDSGSQGQTCTTSTSQQTVTDDNGTYTCETSQQITDTTPSCTQTLVVDTSSTYTYACTNTYDVNARTWDISSACAALGASSACTKTGSSCTTSDPGQFKATQCTKGVEWTTSTQTCQSGTGWSNQTETCDPVRLITVGTNYVYDGDKTWDGSTWQPDSAEQALQNAGSTCQIQATNCTASSQPQTYTCQTGYATTQTAATCNQDLSVQTAPYWQYLCEQAGTYLWGDGSWNPDDKEDCQEFANNSTCSLQSTGSWTQTARSGTKTVSIVQPTYTYQCGQTVKPEKPDYVVLQSQGANGVDDSWGSCSQDSQSGCVKNGTVCLDQGGWRTVNGYSIYRSCWSRATQYTCSATQNAPGCSPPSGSSETSNTCAASDSSGACTEWNQTWTTPGQCTTWTDQWLCTAPVPGAGNPVSEQKYVASDTWSNDCSQYASTSTCSKTSETVEQGPATHTIDGLDVTRDSWQLHDIYTCAIAASVNTCTNVSGCTLSSQTCAQNDPSTGQCALYNDTYTCGTSQPVDGCSGNVNGCTQTGQTCAGNDLSGTCSVWIYNYSCPADDGSGGCLAQTSTYTCSADVPPADPAQSVVTVETGTHWDHACQQATDPTCQAEGTVCNDANSTKTVNGIQVTADCWSQTTSYECEAKGPVQTDCNPPAGCTWDHDQCLDDPAPTDGSCTSMDHVYTCQEQSTKTVTQSSCSTSMCFQGQCFTISGANDSNDLGKAYSALTVGQQGGADYANKVNNLKIMSGTAMRCRKAVLGYSNCCKDSGWGESIGLASCDDQEKSLIKQQETKSCHYVGTYCSNKSFFGICLQKSMRYCCFEGSLARIVNEAGRPQVNKGWGSAKNADCSGFTIDQFQQLDLSNVDFSDFYSQALSGLTEPSASSATSNIQSTLNTLYSGGTPVNPVAMPTIPTGP